jgi:hypothetical protein
MSARILVGTRKGTFLVDKVNGRWRPSLAGHAGMGVNFAARDTHTGTMWALLGLGHWGAKLSRSRDDGQTWEDARQITYPEGARYLHMGFPRRAARTRYRSRSGSKMRRCSSSGTWPSGRAGASTSARSSALPARQMSASNYLCAFKLPMRRSGS